MISELMAQVVQIIIELIGQTGYPGIFLLMTVESALIPIPSEITMPFAGFLAYKGTLDLLTITLVGTVGNLVGSLLAYGLGYYGHERVVRTLIRRWGGYILLTEKDLEKSEKWFGRYGSLTVFLSRMLPALRTVISLPAGIARMELKRFIIYTTIGSFFWSYALTVLGYKLGENWESLGPIFHKFDLVIALLLVFAVAYYIYYKRRELRSELKTPSAQG